MTLAKRVGVGQLRDRSVRIIPWFWNVPRCGVGEGNRTYLAMMARDSLWGMLGSSEAAETSEDLRYGFGSYSKGSGEEGFKLRHG